ncbi:MAG: glycosyltransferase family 2 protein [Flavobacteriales bacterium]|nr:glycosyltransferase family 2 protein [Flavobacteriales bacterium]
MAMRISVIIPCYNVERYVERAVESVFAQTHQDLQVITVDDGSTDGTPALLLELASRHTGRLTVVQQKNQGACAARNAGLERADGTYLQFLDADDVLLPLKLAHQLSIAEKNSSPELVIGSSRIVDPSGTTVRTVVQTAGDRDPWMDLMSHGLNITSTNLWKRQAVQQAGGWSEGLGSSQEYDLMFRMLQHGARVVHDPEVLTEIHQRPGGQISQTSVDRNWVRFVELRARILDHLHTERPDLDLRPYQQVLFDSIRTLYLHAPTKAIDLYHRLLPKGYVPQRSTATGRGYLILHHLFGFTLANRLRSFLR